MRRGRAVLALVLTSGAFVVVGCGDDESRQTVDAKEIERQITQDLALAAGEVKSVSCPDDVTSETGAKFTCSAELSGGGSAKVEVTETQAPDQFAYAFKPGTVELSGASVDRAVEQQLAAGGVANATVNCPNPVKVKPGTTVTCPATGAGGGVGSVSFDFSDASGSIDESSVSAGS